MPRSARIDIPGLLQHVIARGIERRDIFLDQQDRFLFMKRLSDLLEKTQTRCFAWALLSNHFHLLLMSTSTPLSVLMRRLMTGYAVSFNNKYDRSGHLFQNRYKSIVCEEEAYLLELVRYIHLNPLRAGLVSNLEDLERYPWSGHAVLLDNRKLAGQETASILDQFGKKPLGAKKNYRQFVADGVSVGRRDELVGGGLKRSQGCIEEKTEIESFDERILGSGAFVDQLKGNEQLRDRFECHLSLQELIAKVCAVYNLDLAVVEQPSKARGIAEARGLICYVAVRELGCRGKEVGGKLHLGPAGVSLATRRGERTLANTPELKNQLLEEGIET